MGVCSGLAKPEQTVQSSGFQVPSWKQTPCSLSRKHVNPSTQNKLKMNSEQKKGLKR